MLIVLNISFFVLILILLKKQYFYVTGEAVIPVKGKFPGLKIFQRHHFSSALKRMCVVAGYTTGGSLEATYIVSVKGAPETLKDMVKKKFLIIFLNLIY